MRLVLVVMFAVSGCTLESQYLPDGGRKLVNCNIGALQVPVMVLDRTGAPSEGATVNAVNQSDGRHANGTTDSRGVFLVTDELAPGVVQVTATLNDLSGSQQDVTFTCGECDCIATPKQLTLKLK